MDKKAIKAVKVEGCRLTERHRRVSLRRRIDVLNRFIDGWCAYFAFSGTPKPFRELDEWLRRRMRQVCWWQRKRVRTELRMLRKLGLVVTAVGSLVWRFVLQREGAPRGPSTLDPICKTRKQTS